MALWPKKSNVQLVVKEMKDKHQLWTSTMVSSIFIRNSKHVVLIYCFVCHWHECASMNCHNTNVNKFEN